MADYRPRRYLEPGHPILTSDWLFLLLLVPPLAVVAVVDARTGRIPDAANGAILFLGLARAFAFGADVAAGRLLDGAIVGGLLLLLRRAYHLHRERPGLGLGDVKFLVAATVWTGLPNLPFVVLFASLVALLAVALAGLLRGGVGWTTHLRFGPYLALALLAVVLLEPSPVSGPGLDAVFSASDGGVVPKGETQPPAERRG